MKKLAISIGKPEQGCINEDAVIAQENIIKIIDTVLFDSICCMSSNICCGFLILRQMYVKLSIIAIE